mmetsp:Transcript_12602/g.29837  ORF Transcript_12602/g.29837 Transcript_12602/m.29837 type:complete len:89 (+) Transcript_12602:127-393(+)
MDGEIYLLNDDNRFCLGNSSSSLENPVQSSREAFKLISTSDSILLEWPSCLFRMPWYRVHSYCAALLLEKMCEFLRHVRGIRISSSLR